MEELEALKCVHLTVRALNIEGRKPREHAKGDSPKRVLEEWELF